ncbi:CRISPR-associated endoribonuclease Cas6 [Petroclostridium sp. X23]|uniref:CRISPR-associated endoribonuclease Cas6 n=1 Tax=Petroclostridium sp. X23 TaxID=3045146 RepID=UPI0024AD1A81|nr:CRISPR-associated endoribonuclease Cas6 [Petroclostridium sp. X23]WHH60987.1 CRISPR-associated endoribonuclease Cas6 [Petroclostridium sp. X23]
MKYYELINTVYLVKDLPYDETNRKIGQFINKALLYDEDLKDWHKVNCYKFYVYNSLYPIESGKIYKAGKTYVFRIRSLSKEFLAKIEKILPVVTDDCIKILSVQQRDIHQRHIIGLRTITPAIATIDGNYWRQRHDVLKLIEQIQLNLLKKYKSYYGEDLIINNNFIKYIEFDNHTPIALKYKDMTLIGNKFHLIINNDAVSQKLAFIALAAGILEKNSSNGMGFCLPIYA